MFTETPGGFHGAVLAPFRSILDGHLRTVDQGLQDGNLDAVRLAAHTLKGAARNLGFVGLGTRAESLEQAARQGGLTGGGQQEGLRLEAQAVLTFIQKEAGVRP